ncbi:Urokinase-type plasminogen activator [Varanus komodoensis]|nr:Urokinase-type plasminogen activator [Varanus komodoensis]
MDRAGVDCSRTPETTNVHLISQSVRQRNDKHQTVIGDMISAGGGERQTDSCKGDAGSPVIREADARKELCGTYLLRRGRKGSKKPHVACGVEK